MGWKADGETGSELRDGHPKPSIMCQGRPGQLIARNGRSADEECISVFDITKIPFDVVIPRINLGRQVQYMCYCHLPGEGDALAFVDSTAVNSQSKLRMFSLESRKYLWGADGKDVRGQLREVTGATWYPQGICSDNRGRLYVADWKHDNNRIIVFSAASGLVLQELKDQSLQQPMHLCWLEKTKSVIASTEKGVKIVYLHISF